MSKLKSWQVIFVIVFAVSIALVGIIIYTISTAPRADYEFIDKSVVTFSGDKKQMATDSMVIKIYPNRNKIDIINVSGEFYKLKFNQTTGRDDRIDLSRDEFKRLFLQISINGSEETYDIGFLKRDYVVVNPFNAFFFPLSVHNNTDIKLTFTYKFRDIKDIQEYVYVFKPRLRLGYVK